MLPKHITECYFPNLGKKNSTITDEKWFVLDGEPNRSNHGFRSKIKPEEVVESHYQEKTKKICWMALVKTKIFRLFKS